MAFYAHFLLLVQKYSSVLFALSSFCLERHKMPNYIGTKTSIYLLKKIEHNLFPITFLP